MALTYVVAYDISDDGRRARVAATVQVWGNRVQRRVFVCTLDPDQLTELTDRLAGIIDPDTDSVYAFRQCSACWDAAVVLGQATVEEEPRYWAIL
jgi:CRISPR-associated protein Cas2